MSQNLKEQFLAIARHDIHREGIENLLTTLEESDFFKAPASTRYHGSYEGGLVQHSIDVYNALHDELAFIYGDNYLAVFNEETIAIVSLFHDICKVDRYKAGYRNVKDEVTKQWHQEPAYFYNDEKFEMGHGAESVYAIQRHMKLEDFEAQAIYWHMGAYDISNYSNLNGLGSAFERNVLSFALHRADMFATYIIDNKFFKEAPAVEEEIEQPNMENEEAEINGNITGNEEYSFNPADYEDWSIDDIKAEIVEWGGEPKKRAKKSELIKQLGKLMQADTQS